jgi:hypothetical protein
MRIPPLLREFLFRASPRATGLVMVSSICWRNIGISFIDLGMGQILNECKSPDCANDPLQSRARRMLNIDQYGRLFFRHYCVV